MSGYAVLLKMMIFSTLSLGISVCFWDKAYASISSGPAVTVTCWPSAPPRGLLLIAAFYDYWCRILGFCALVRQAT